MVSLYCASTGARQNVQVAGSGPCSHVGSVGTESIRGGVQIGGGAATEAGGGGAATASSSGAPWSGTKGTSRGAVMQGPVERDRAAMAEDREASWALARPPLPTGSA